MEKCGGNDDICITSLGAQQCWAIIWVLRNFWSINCSLFKILLEPPCKVLKFNKIKPAFKVNALFAKHVKGFLGIKVY